MTAGKPHAPARPLGQRPKPPGAPSHQGATARQFFEHSSASRISTEAVIAEAVRAEYPQLHLSVVPQFNCDLLGYAAAGHAGLAQIDREQDRLSWRLFLPPAKRLYGSGGLADNVKLGKYLLDYKGKEYIIYVVDARDGTEYFSAVSLQFVLSPSPSSTNQLLLEAGAWNNQLHNEIWVFDGGFWQKSYELWDSIQKSSWDDVILEKSKKEQIIADVDDFFGSRDTYEKLKVPWKRGVIYYGPPGNGKTISIKAMMHALYERKEVIPTLYVKSLSSFFGPEDSINQIFVLARRTAPCYLVFEDLDSVVSDDVRSYFLNAVDGIAKNDGIFMGSTNHLDRLDPGIAKRPSRFDRKYLFPNPDEEQRVAYMKYWQGKLSDNDELEFPDKLASAAAKITHGFSFAYMQEAMIASLLAIAREKDGYAERVCLECMEAHERPASGGMCEREGRRVFKGLYDWVSVVRSVDEGDRDLDDYVLWRELKKQVRLLREEMGEEGNRIRR